MRLDIQFAVAAIPPHIPRNLRGYISELTIQGTVPIPGEKKMITESAGSFEAAGAIPKLRRGGAAIIRAGRRRIEMRRLGAANSRGMRSGLVKHRRQKSEGEHDANQAENQELLPPRPINEVNTHDRADGIQPGGDEREEERRLVGGDAGQLNDGGAVVHHGVDAHELLEDLEPHAGY
nr:Os07g0151250 [Ipomoea batatas]